MIKYLIIVVATFLSFQTKAQTWVAPGGGYYNPILNYNLYADNNHNCLYHFTNDTNALINNVWYHLYSSTNILRYAGNPIPFTDNKNYFFKNYNENGDATKPRTALISWTNGNDLDTIRTLKGTYNVYYPNQLNGKFYVTVFHDTINYRSYLAEFDGFNLKNLIFDTIWKGNHWNGISQTITYKNEVYGIPTGSDKFNGSCKIIVLRNGIWQPLLPWKGLDNGVIVKMLIYNDRLYFIGGFWPVENSTIPGNSVIAWDGQNWDNLGGGIEHYGAFFQGGVNDAVICNNKIYFVGPFDHAGGLKSSKVVTWNDTNWCAVGGDLDSSFTISQIECLKDTVYVQGNLANVHGVNLGTIGKMRNMNYQDSCRQIFTSVSKLDRALSSISIEPNPSNSIVRIKYNGTEPIVHLLLFNSLGQKMQEIFKPQELEINISHFSGGIYYLSIQTKNEQKLYQILKE